MKVVDAIAQARAAAEALRAEFPDAEADLDLWDSSVESMTDALDVADWLVARSLDREAMAAAAKQRADDLKARAERFSRAAKGAKAAALAILDAAGVKKRERPEFTVTVRAGQPAVLIPEPGAVPLAFLRQPPPEPDKAAIKAALLAGEQVPGAALSNAAPFLTVRVR